MELKRSRQRQRSRERQGWWSKRRSRERPEWWQRGEKKETRWRMGKGLEQQDSNTWEDAPNTPERKRNTTEKHNTSIIKVEWGLATSVGQPSWNSRGDEEEEQWEPDGQLYWRKCGSVLGGRKVLKFLQKCFVHVLTTLSTRVVLRFFYFQPFLLFIHFRFVSNLQQIYFIFLSCFDPPWHVSDLNLFVAFRTLQRDEKKKRKWCR